MVKRTLTIAAATLCGLVTVASANPVKVNIGYVSAVGFLPAFVPKENGCYAANGIDAQFTRIPTTTNMPAAIVADTIQVGTMTATLFLPAVENGLDLVAVVGGTRLLKGNEISSLVTSTKFQVKHPSDLVGKTIGVPGVNSVGDVILRKWLRNEGVDPSKVRIVETPFPQMKDLIKSGQIDGAVAVEPIRSMIIKEGVGQLSAVEYHTAVTKDSILAFWVSSKKWADKNPQAVIGIRRCMAEAISWIAANRDQAREIEKRYIGFEAPTVRPDFDVALKDEDFAFYIDVNLELGVMRNRVNAKNLIWKER